MSKKKIVLILTGGLGNQLFQLRFVEHLQRNLGAEVLLDINMGKPRGKNNRPDSFEFGIPCQVIESKYSKLAAKSMGYLLRSGYAPRNYETSKLFKIVVKLIVSAIQSLHFRRILIASAPTNLGFDSIFKMNASNMVIMGYFQSHIYSPVLMGNFRFSVNPQSEQISKYRDLATEEKPLIVHVRRGDYGSEDQFGLLGPSYYGSAIAQIEKLSQSRKIWLFSDEPQKALSLFSKPQKDRIRLVEEVDGLPAHTLEVMRFGSGYVIANSTFSWWAAKSAYNSDAPVAAPDKWFKGLETPADIIPVTWHLFESDFL